MNPGEIIDLGFRIVDDEDYHQEARIRTAINRIYYGTLHFIRRTQGIAIGDERKFHSELVRWINSRDKILGSLVNNMKEMREKADYYINLSIGERQFEKVETQFKKITEYIETNS